MVCLERLSKYSQQSFLGHGSHPVDGAFRAHPFQQYLASSGAAVYRHRVLAAGRPLRSDWAFGQFHHHRLFCVSHWRWQCSIPRLIRIFIKVVSVNFLPDPFMRLELRLISSVRMAFGWRLLFPCGNGMLAQSRSRWDASASSSPIPFGFSLLRQNGTYF